MPYTRPAAPLEVNPNVTLLPDPIVWAFGTAGSHTSFGRGQQEMAYFGDAGLLSEDADSWNILYSPTAAFFAPDSTALGMNGAVFTRVITFDVDTDTGNPANIWASNKENGGGYLQGALRVSMNTSFEIVFEVLYRKELARIAGQIIKDAKNSVAFSVYADGTCGISVNGNDAVMTDVTGPYTWNFSEMFGNKEWRGDWQQGLRLNFYAQSNSSVTGAVLKQLSANPAQIVRTVGSGTVPDTTPPALMTLGSTADGAAILLSANEALKVQAVPLASVTISGGHTVTGITINDQIATIAISPPLALGEAPPTASYSASAAGFVDLAGNQLPGFTNQSVANNVGASFWKFLGNEGQTATVAAGTRVRYGITGAYVEKVMSGTFTIDNATFTDPSPGAIKHADALVNGVATGYTIEGPSIGPVGESSPFTVAIDGLVAGDMVVTPAGTGLTFSPATVVLNNANMSATFSVFSTTAGDYSITLTNNKNFANPAAKSYKAITSIFRTFGTGGDSPDLASAINTVGQTDPAGAKIMVVLEGLSDQASVNATVNPTSANESFYYLIRPKKELQFGELNRNGALHENMSGATLNLSSGQLNIGGGVVIEGYKINITGFQALKLGKGGAGPEPTLRRCFVIANADQSITNEAYKASRLQDSFFVRTTANAGRLINAPWVLKIDRCTFYNKGGNAAVKAHDGGWGNGAAINNTAYVGFGNDPIEQIGGFVRLNNVSTSPMGDSGGFIVDQANAAFVSSSNYRAGPALIGKAGVDAKSVNDVLGNNRGTSPDVGAAQGTAALPLATGTVTNQPDPDAARVTGFFTYEGTVTSATVTLNAISDGQSVGPLPVTVSGGTGSYQIDGVVPGAYSLPDVQLINAGGSNRVDGFVPFEINGVGGGPIDPGTQAAATAVVVNGPTSGQVGVVSTSFSVGLNGSYSGTVRVTPSEVGSGTFNPAFVDLVNGGLGSFVYTPSSGGVKSISIANDKGLQNPTALPYAVTVPQVIVPKVVLPLTTDGTVPVANMTGLQYSWFDQPLPQNFTAPKLKGNNGVIDAGSFTLILEGSDLQPGGTGFLVLSNTNGDVAQSPAALVFAGSVKVQ